MIKSRKAAKRLAEEFIANSLPAFALEDLEVHKVGELWIADVKSSITGSKRLSIKIDSKNEKILGVEIPKKIDETIIRRKIKKCERCGETFSLQDLKITRTRFEGSHKHILVINVSCPRCRRALSPIRLARKNQKTAYLEYLEMMRSSPEYYMRRR